MHQMLLLFLLLNLASVSDMKDQRRLERVLDGLTDVWIGLHQTSVQLKDRKWHWSQPTVTYEEAGAQWGRGKPDDRDGPQNCAAIGSKWFDKSCSHKYNCIVCYNESSSSVQIHDDKGRSWLEAQQYCRRHHTDLMSGLDQQEQVEEVKPFGKSSCWIGLFRDTWSWSDESPSSFRNWNSDSDRAINPETEKCAAVGGDGGWKSSDCGRKKSFVCAGGNLVLVKQNKTWEEALIYCRQNHRDLVWNIDTEPWKTQVQDQVQDQVRRSDSKLVWVGLHYACFFEAWFWVNGHYVPDDHKDWRKPGEGDCGDVAAVKKNGQWVNRKFVEEHNFICVRSCGCCHGN